MTGRRKTQRKVPYPDKWRIPDELWAQIEPLLPPGKPHPLGCHNPPVGELKVSGTFLEIISWPLKPSRSAQPIVL